MARRSKDAHSTAFEQPGRRSFLGRGALLLLGRAGHLAFADDALPSGRLFSIERVSKHVYAAIAQTAPVVNGNSALIVTQEGLVVVDSQSWPGAAPLSLQSVQTRGRSASRALLDQYSSSSRSRTWQRGLCGNVRFSNGRRFN